MERSIPSEEKLLKLIRKKGHRTENRSSAANQGAGMPSGEKKDSRGPLGGLAAANTVLVLIILALLGYGAANRFLFKHKTVQDLTQDIEVAIQREDSGQMKKVMKTLPYSFYSQGFEVRDIFLPYESDAPQRDILPMEIDPTKTLKLVGVVLDNDPEVIVEDLTTQQTFFLHKGDSIKDSIIEDIQESRVILRYQGKLFEINQ